MQNNNSPQLPTKQYAEDKDSFKSMFLDELRNHKNFIEDGNDDSISGSDDEPSEDNMTNEELCQVIPAVNKKLKNALKKLKSGSLKDKKVEKKLSPKSKNQDTADLEKIRRYKRDDFRRKFEKRKHVMVDAWTQTEESDYPSMVKYETPKPISSNEEIDRISQQNPNHSSILPNPDYRKGYEKQLSSSFKDVITPHHNRAPSYIKRNYTNTNINNRIMREKKSLNNVRDGIGNLKSHSNARGYKSTFYDSINAGGDYWNPNNSNNRKGSINMGHRRKSKREAEMLKQAYHTEEFKYQQPNYNSVQKPNSRLNRSKLRHNHPNLKELHEPLARNKHPDSSSINHEHTHPNKWNESIYGSSKSNMRDPKFQTPSLKTNSSKLLKKSTADVFDQNKSQNSNITLRNPNPASGSKNANFRIRFGKTN